MRTAVRQSFFCLYRSRVDQFCQKLVETVGIACIMIMLDTIRQLRTVIMMDVKNDQEFIYAVLERLSSASDLAQAIQAAQDALAQIQEGQ